MRFWALLFLLGCGDNDQAVMFCGIRDCGEFQAATTAQCLLDSFVKCTPARGAIIHSGETKTYEIGVDCSITVAKATSYEVCVGLSFEDLDNSAKCPWLMPAGCGPVVSKL